MSVSYGPVPLGSVCSYTYFSQAVLSVGASSVITGNVGQDLSDASFGGTGLSGRVRSNDKTFCEFYLRSFVCRSRLTFFFPFEYVATVAAVSGKIFANDYASPTPNNIAQAELDQETAFNFGMQEAPPTAIYGAIDLIGQTLTPGM